jgi:hypothetical protein
MPTQLILSYTAYAYATVPNDIARKMKDGTIDWWSKWGDIYYIDEKGEEQKIDGHEGETDYKRHEGHEWDDEVEEEVVAKDEPLVEGVDYEVLKEDDDDNKSVHSTCCVECGESFKFDAPVSAEDYHNGNHDQHCPSCEEESDDENGSVCFRVPHEYNEHDCSDNCPHKPGNEKDEEEEEDCLAGNPKCVKCKIYLSEDDMAVWTEDTTKEPMCEHCLDEEDEEDEESGDDERMIHDRLDWEKRYSDEKHEECDEDECPGQTCGCNQLCAGCDCVLSKRVHVYCLECKVGCVTVETLVCSECFYDIVDGMRAENQITKKWVVDGNDDWENDETYSS